MKELLRKIIKEIWGIDGISLFVKKQKKSFFQKFYTKKYSADDLIKIMCDMGMQKGTVVFIHSSMTEFYNYKDTPVELIEKIINVIGEDGTLMMPAYPKNKFKILKSESLDNTDVDFDINSTQSGAGYLSEVFRTYPGVKRSINLQHSVCAWGKLADEFTSEHHLSITAWDKFSPYYKMSQTNTMIFSFGLPKMLGTVIHCVESILYGRYKYFDQFFSEEVSYRYKDYDGKIGIHNFRTHNLKIVTNKDKIVKKYFDKRQIKIARISNLPIKMIHANYLLDTLLDLASRGITVYEKPSPNNYIKEGKFIEK